MANISYDKKQLPQIIGLGAASLGLFGYFGCRMIAPPPTQAATPPPNSTGAPTAPMDGAPGEAATTASVSTTVSPADATALIGAPPPAGIAASPFTPGLQPVAPPTPPPLPSARPGAGKPLQVASLDMGEGTTLHGLPGIGDVRPIPVPGRIFPGIGSAAPAPVVTPITWNVTGIIQSDADPSAAVVIFRSGDERRYVVLGKMIDETTRLIGIDRNGVTVLRGNSRIRLSLGSASAAKPLAPNPALSSMPEIQDTPQSAATTPAAGQPAPSGTVIAPASAAPAVAGPSTTTPAPITVPTGLEPAKPAP